MTDPDVVQHECSEGQLAPWFTPIDLSRPFWRDYRQLILQLQTLASEGPDLPTARQLQQILPDHALNQSGQALKFLPGKAIPGIEYEMHIFRSGAISTRENSWHDLFNALVWARFPRLKSAINAVHCQQIRSQGSVPRGRLRDALTLWDESGIILASTNTEVLTRLSARDWQAVFREQATRWQDEIRIFVCGHALMEKFLKPYKSLTARALLIQLDPAAAEQSKEDLLKMLDARLAETLLEGALFDSPAGLSPVPLMGIPGWWPRAEQDESFYADRQVFRPPIDGFLPAPVFDLAGFDNHQDMP